MNGQEPADLVRYSQRGGERGGVREGATDPSVIRRGRDSGCTIFVVVVAVVLLLKIDGSKAHPPAPGSLSGRSDGRVHMCIHTRVHRSNESYPGPENLFVLSR